MEDRDDDEVPDWSASIHHRIAELARDMHGANGGTIDPDAVLEQVTQTAVALLPGVDHAGITLVRGRRPELTLESTAETGPTARRFDELQHEVGDGPCFEAIWQHRTVSIPDISTDDRWPSLMEAVNRTLPIRSSLSIQLFTNGDELGALNLHSNTSDAFDEDLEDLAIDLATHAAIALSGARRSRQFLSALASRDIIGQAKGIIMERYDTDALRAFDMLRRISQDTNTPLAELALRLVDADHPTA